MCTKWIIKYKSLFICHSISIVRIWNIISESGKNSSSKENWNFSSFSLSHSRTNPFVKIFSCTFFFSHHDLTLNSSTFLKAPNALLILNIRERMNTKNKFFVLKVQVSEGKMWWGKKQKDKRKWVFFHLFFCDFSVMKLWRVERVKKIYYWDKKGW